MAINVGQVLSGIGQVILGSTNSTAVTNTPVPPPVVPTSAGMSTGVIIACVFGGIVLIGGVAAIIITSKK
jgi:hypothetical protein